MLNAVAVPLSAIPEAALFAALPASHIAQLQGNVVTAYAIPTIVGPITIVIATSQLFSFFTRQVTCRSEKALCRNEW